MLTPVTPINLTAISVFSEYLLILQIESRQFAAIYVVAYTPNIHLNSLVFIYLKGFFTKERNEPLTDYNKVLEPSVLSTTALSTVNIIGAAEKAAKVPAIESIVSRFSNF